MKYLQQRENTLVANLRLMLLYPTIAVFSGSGLLIKKEMREAPILRFVNFNIIYYKLHKF